MRGKGKVGVGDRCLCLKTRKTKLVCSDECFRFQIVANCATTSTSDSEVPVSVVARNKKQKGEKEGEKERKKEKKKE
jgi:hypothetical protein